MYRTFLKGKIHKATVTEADLHYEGSISIDALFLEEAGITPFEQVDVYNVNNGARLTTYAIPAPAGSKKIGLNGAAARCAMAGDLVIIACYALLEPHEVAEHQPRLVLMGPDNEISQVLLGSTELPLAGAR